MSDRLAFYYHPHAQTQAPSLAIPRHRYLRFPVLSIAHLYCTGTNRRRHPLSGARRNNSSGKRKTAPDRFGISLGVCYTHKIAHRFGDLLFYAKKTVGNYRRIPSWRSDYYCVNSTLSRTKRAPKLSDKRIPPLRTKWGKRPCGDETAQ